MKKYFLNEVESIYATVFLLFPCIIFSLFFLSLLFNVIFFPYIFTVSVILTCFILLFVSGLSYKKTFVHLVFSFAIVGAAIYISCLTIDLSWDARDYHLPASLIIGKVWNPLFVVEPKITEFTPSFAILCFPKAQWYINAVMINTFKNIEAGKFNHIILIIACFLIVNRALKIFPMTSIYRYLVALLVALNPIAVFQLQLNYLDGLVASCLSILFFSLLRLAYQKDDEFIFYAVLATLLSCNLKFSGFVFALFFWGALLAISIIKRSSIGWKFKYFFISFLLSIVLGFNPYITNTVNYRSPLYPLITIGGNVTPGEVLKRPYFKRLNRFERFFLSYTSSTNFIRQDETEPWRTWKSPFRINNLINFWYLPELARTNGGFGPLFGFVLFITLPFLVFSDSTLLVFVISLFLTIFLHSEGWHARYCPQVWLLPLLSALAVFSAKQKAPMLLFMLVPVVLFLNIGLMVRNYNSAQQVKMSEYRRSLSGYKATGVQVDGKFIAQYLPVALFQYPLPLERFIFVEKKRLQLLGFKVRDEITVSSK